MIGRGPDAPLEILLITSCETRRWVIPKGNIDFHMAPHQAAAQEALEEAGALGEIGRAPVGVFTYCKDLKRGAPVIAKVTVFPLAVSGLLEDWEERDRRERRWFPQDSAARAVDEPELQALIQAFRPID